MGVGRTGIQERAGFRKNARAHRIPETPPPASKVDQPDQNHSDSEIDKTLHAEPVPYSNRGRAPIGARRARAHDLLARKGGGSVKLSNVSAGAVCGRRGPPGRRVRACRGAAKSLLRPARGAGRGGLLGRAASNAASAWRRARTLLALPRSARRPGRRRRDAHASTRARRRAACARTSPASQACPTGRAARHRGAIQDVRMGIGGDRRGSVHRVPGHALRGVLPRVPPHRRGHRRSTTACARATPSTRCSRPRHRRRTQCVGCGLCVERCVVGEPRTWPSAS